MNTQDLYAAICNDPESNELRLEFADAIEPVEPLWARIIRKQVNRCYADDDWPSYFEAARRWSPGILKFCGPEPVLRFVRGFPMLLHIHPLVFLQNASMIFRVAPIRHVRITENIDYDTGVVSPMPMDDLMACPYLSRLDTFGFYNAVLPPDAYAKVAASPHLTRCQWMVFMMVERRSTPLEESPRTSLPALLDGELTRKMVCIDAEGIDTLGEYHPPYEELWVGGVPSLRTLFRSIGRAAEQRHGYIPWLHPSHHPRVLYEDRVVREVAEGKLPKFPAGTKPVDEDWYLVPIKRNPADHVD